MGFTAEAASGKPVVRCCNVQRVSRNAPMDAYEKIQAQMAEKYGRGTTTRKAIGDFMLSDGRAVNVKSNNLDKENYSPNMISIKKMHECVFEERKELSFLFVDYRESGGE